MSEQALEHLKRTTIGYVQWADRVANGYKGKPYDATKTEWGKALALLEQQSEPVPGELPFAEAPVVSPLRPSIGLTQTTFNCETSKDYILDGGMQPRSKTLILTGSPRYVQVRNFHFRITEPTSQGPYWRGGLGLQLKAKHVSITDYFVEADHPGCTLADGLRIACAADTKVTVQRARIEAMSETLEAAEHCDAVQVQGPIGRIEIGLATLQAAGVRAPNHGGKCLQIAHEPWPAGTYGGPFSVSYKHVNLVGKGSGLGRFGTMFIRGPEKHHVTGVLVGPITVDIENMHARADGTGATDFSGWFATYTPGPAGAVSGSAPNRRITFDPASKITGHISEGGTDFVTRSMLGV